MVIQSTRRYQNSMKAWENVWWISYRIHEKSYYPQYLLPHCKNRFSFPVGKKELFSGHRRCYLSLTNQKLNSLDNGYCQVGQDISHSFIAECQTLKIALDKSNFKTCRLCLLLNYFHWFIYRNWCQRATIVYFLSQIRYVCDIFMRFDKRHESHLFFHSCQVTEKLVILFAPVFMK